MLILFNINFKLLCSILMFDLAVALEAPHPNVRAAALRRRFSGGISEEFFF